MRRSSLQVGGNSFLRCVCNFFAHVITNPEQYMNISRLSMTYREDLDIFTRCDLNFQPTSRGNSMIKLYSKYTIHTYNYLNNWFLIHCRSCVLYIRTMEGKIDRRLGKIRYESHIRVLHPRDRCVLSKQNKDKTKIEFAKYEFKGYQKTKGSYLW